MGSDLARFHAASGRTVKWTLGVAGIEVIGVRAEEDPRDAVAAYLQTGLVDWAEPDYALELFATPNDTFFASNQWTLDNTGQTGGSAGADIHATAAWDIRTHATNVIVAILDTGIDYTHEDLAANMWANAVDGSHGWFAFQHTNNPADTNGHGTHVAGIIGAVGSNSVGIAGVAWGVSLMACRIDTNNGVGLRASYAIESIDFAVAHGAKIINASWGMPWGPADTNLNTQVGGLFLAAALQRAANAGAVCVAAAGNEVASDSDFLSDRPYPANYRLDNIVSVAATTHTDDLATYSKYGLASTHLGAPGGSDPATNSVFSSYWPWGLRPTNYAWKRGTSFAAPHVSGAFALAKAEFPDDSYLGLFNRVLSSVDALNSLTNKCITGGRLNLYRLLSSTSSAPANDTLPHAYRLTFNADHEVLTVAANNAGASKDTGEPDHAGNQGGSSVWWSWTPTGTFASDIVITTSGGPNSGNPLSEVGGSTFDTLLAVYTGTTVTNLALVASNDDYGSNVTSQIRFTPTNGVTYHIVVDGKNCAAGRVSLALWNSAFGAPPSGSWLRIAPGSLSRGTGSFQFVAAGPSNATVIVEASTNLLTWSGILTNTVASSGLCTNTDWMATNSLRIYRLVSEWINTNSVYVPTNRIFSDNSVGYCDLTIPSGDSLVANQFDRADNRISTLLPAPPEGLQVWKYDEGGGGFVLSEYDSFFGGWSDPDLTLGLWEGALLTSPTNFTWTILGEVAQGHRAKPVGSGSSMRSVPQPVAGLVATDLLLPVAAGDIVSVMVGGNYFTSTNAVTGWMPNEPTVNVGQSFWINKSNATQWQRNFAVWPLR
jgi:subtilisin family serine protease